LRVAPNLARARQSAGTRIPKELHRRLRLYCVTHDIVLMHFVVAAIEGKLVLAVLDCSTPDTVADAVLVASLLDVPEAEVVRLLDELEQAGCVASAPRPVQ
jgi:hypothetical protein